MTDKTNPVDLDALDALHKDATPGPWHREPLYWTMRIVEKAGHDVAEGLPDGTMWPRWPSRDDADYIVALRNAYPALSAELRRLRELVREQAEARDAWDDWVERDSGKTLETAWNELDRAEEALYAAGKEIDK